MTAEDRAAVELTRTLPFDAMTDSYLRDAELNGHSLVHQGSNQFRCVDCEGRGHSKRPPFFRDRCPRNP